MSTACPIENSTQLATTLDSFYDELEPLEEYDPSEQAIAIAALIDAMFTTGDFNEPPTNEMLRLRMQRAFRKFVALAYVMRPTAISHRAITARQVAESLSMTRQGLSILCVEWSDKLKMRSGGMKSPEARESYRRAGGGAIGRSTKRPAVGTIGDDFRDESLCRDQTRTADAAIGKLINGGTWSRLEVRALLALGLTNEEGQLTADGERRVQEMRAEASV